MCYILWVRLNYATTHHHPPPPTSCQNISTTIFHHPPTAKIYPPLSTFIHYHPLSAKIYPPPSTTTHQQQKHSLFNMKITASLTKSWHQDRGPCYLLIFFLIHTLCASAGKEKVVVSKLDHRLLSTDYNHIYYETVLV